MNAATIVIAVMVITPILLLVVDLVRSRAAGERAVQDAPATARRPAVLSSAQGSKTRMTPSAGRAKASTVRIRRRRLGGSE
jgi:hypothetical protein